MADTSADRLALAALALFALAATLTFRDYGLGWDDYTHSEYGDLLLKLYGSGFADRDALSFVNLYMYGGGFDMAAALAAKVLPFTLFETRRLTGAVAGLIGYILAWRTGRRIGGPVAGLASLLLLLATPHYYGHVFMNAKDAPFAVAALALLYGCVRVIEDYPRPSPQSVAAFGLGIGFAFGTRILAGVSGLEFVIALAFIVPVKMMREPPSRALHDAGIFIAMLLPAGLIGYLVMGLLWPWSILRPANPLTAVAYFSHFFEKPWKELYEGALVSVPDMPASYVPNLFMLKLSEATLALGLTGVGLALWHAGSPKRAPADRAVHLLIVLAALLPVAITIITRPALYNGIRHFLFVTPPLAILGGLAAGRVWDIVRGRAWYAVAATIFAAGLAVPVADMARLHPYQYTHFNRLAGGVSGADEHYMLDYWGLAFKEASEQLRATLEQRGETPPRDRKWVVGVCGPQRPAQVALGADFRTIGNPVGADFAMMLGAFYCRDLALPVLAEITRDDVIFARVYDLRGQKVTNFLTITPP